ncbi:MAG: hypothetical protein JJU00_03485 [Opitutales bacterium]|nr:hypothetical protein [Opitutales bacterium]
MATRILADNWTFQNAGEFTCEGLKGDDARELVIPQNENSFHYQEVSYDLLRFDALCQVLNHLVLSDEVWVDEAFSDTWEEFEPLAKAKIARVVVPKPFKEFKGNWIRAREAMGDQLCVNKAVRKAHRKNKRQWAKDKTTPDPMLSQLIWGGSGMLARADCFKLPYSPHPLREKIVKRATCLNGPDAQVKLSEFISSERLKIFRQLGKAGFMGTVHLPPIAVEVIEASTDLSDLVRTALQLRDSYQKVRKWLGQLQRDLSNESIKEVLAHEKRLQEISRHLNSYSSVVSPQGETTMQIGVSWLKLSTKGGPPVNSIKNRFGMRAEVNRLVLRPPGHGSIKKLLRMLGEQNTKLGMRFTAELSERSTAQTL